MIEALEVWSCCACRTSLSDATSDTPATPAGWAVIRSSSVVGFSLGVLRLPSDWSLPCERGHDYAS